MLTSSLGAASGYPLARTCHKNARKSSPDRWNFLVWCRGRGLSPKTWRDAYGYPLRAVLLPYCERQGIADLTDLDRRAVDRLAAELYQREPPLSQASVKSYLKSVNQLMAWWEHESGEKQARAQLPRLKKKPREVLSRAELDDLEAAAPNERDRSIPT
jgi:site-specific recombinase XerD